MGKHIKANGFAETAKNNRLSWQLYFDRLLELSISMFEWQNVPDSIDTRFLEINLFDLGFCVFFKDEVLGELALPCAAGGNLDVYGIPVHRRAYADNGYQKELTSKDSVIIYNNMLHENSYLPVREFAMKLYNLDRAIEINANAQKTPILITCDEKQRLSLKNVYMKYEGNEPFIFGNKDLDIRAFNVLKTDAPYVADKLYQLKTQIWNEALTYLGISSTNTQKRERLLTDEVIRNLGGTIASRYSRLTTRQKACEQINKMFGLNMQCVFREDYREINDNYLYTGETDNEGVDKIATDFDNNKG